MLNNTGALKSIGSLQSIYKEMMASIQRAPRNGTLTAVLTESMQSLQRAPGQGTLDATIEEQAASLRRAPKSGTLESIAVTVQPKPEANLDQTA